jgi:SAM-dependent methyltransferase
MTQTPAEFATEYAKYNYSFLDDPESELIARLLVTHAHGPRILDLGCGPVHHSVRLFLPKDALSTGADISSDNINHSKKILESGEISEGNLRAIKFLYTKIQQKIAPDDPASLIREQRQQIENLCVHDIRDFEPSFGGNFDTVMQIGCFLSLNTLAELQSALDNVNRYLVPGGVFINANWLQDEYKERPFGFNGKLSELLKFESYCEALQSSGLSLMQAGKSLDVHPFTKKHGYTQLVWAVLRKAGSAEHG